MNAHNGPYIQAACFCELFLRDDTGTISIIRIIDNLTHTESGPNPPEEMPPVPFVLKFVLMLKSGEARGRHTLRVIPELPSGETLDPLTFTIHFDNSEDGGQNLLLNFGFTFTLEGLHWFKVFLDDAFLTALPFRVKYNRVIAGTSVR